MLTEPDPAASVNKLNNLLYPHTSQMDRFVTFAAVVLDPVAHTVTLVSAGHQSPILLRHANKTLTDAMPKDVPGLPLGMLDGYDYSACQVVLQPGDVLIIFTDGVSDAVNVRNTAFGNQGIHAAIQASGSASAKMIGERITKAVTQHASGRPQHDDITLVCLSRTS